jgi:hypothetical protein
MAADERDGALGGDADCASEGGVGRLVIYYGIRGWNVSESSHGWLQETGVRYKIMKYEEALTC